MGLRKMFQLRIDAKMTQGQLSNLIGVSQERLSYIECGLEDSDNDTLERLANVLKSTPEELMEELK